MELTYQFFWRGPFSNWHMADFTEFGIKYNCVEQYMMANKAALFDDNTAHVNIMASNNPHEMKHFGHTVRGFSTTRWNYFRDKIVFNGCLYKFTQNDYLHKALLNTGDAVLVEASPYDRIWGIGYSADDAMDNIDNWGENRLGKILTEVRRFLKT